MRVRRVHGPVGRQEAARRGGAVVGAVLAASEPGMLEDVTQADAVLGPYPQAGQDQVLALGGDGPTELDVGRTDLFVLLEGNVALDHVEEEDAEGPDGERVGPVPVAADPLRRRVHTGA